MHPCTRDPTCSQQWIETVSPNSQGRVTNILGLRATAVLSCVYLHLFYITRTHAKQRHTETSFSRILDFLAQTNLSYRNKIKWNGSREIRTYLLYATSPAPIPLQYSRQYCPTATYIRHSISNNQISSYTWQNYLWQIGDKISICHALWTSG